MFFYFDEHFPNSKSTLKPKHRLGPTWRHLSAPLASLAALARSLRAPCHVDRLGSIVALRGAILERLGAILARFGAILARRGAILGRLG